ncbi:MAG: serine/threonine-protein kinase [Neisseria sp.]|nr:serine/threonine-protein kinase [Neisseria sp.]
MAAPNVKRADALPDGSRLNNTYIVQSVLGSGAFGITYLAEHVHLGSQHVIKEYFPDSGVRVEGLTVVAKSTADQELFDWGFGGFFKEAKLLYSLNHTNIVKVSDLFEANGTAYFVMPYIRGITLHQWIRENQKPSESDLTRIFIPLLDGLKYIHDKQLLHRDIKPENILITEDQTPVLIDFGAARQAIGQKSRPLTQILTPPFAPIEQYHSRDVFLPALDLYSLGACIYQAVTHQLIEEAPARIADTDTQPRLAGSSYEGRYSHAFLAAVDYALNVKAENRFQNATDMQQALLGHMPQQAQPPYTQDAGAQRATQVAQPGQGGNAATTSYPPQQSAGTAYVYGSQGGANPPPYGGGGYNNYGSTQGGFNPPPSVNNGKKIKWMPILVLFAALAVAAAWFVWSDAGGRSVPEPRAYITSGNSDDPPIVIAGKGGSKDDGDTGGGNGNNGNDGGSGDNNGGGGSSSDEISEDDIRDMNKDLPKTLGDNLRLDRVYLAGGRTLVWQMTYTNVRGDQFTSEQKEQIRDILSQELAKPACENSQIRKWMGNGGVLVVSLYGKDGKPIVDAEVRGRHCK